MPLVLLLGPARGPPLINPLQNKRRLINRLIHEKLLRKIRPIGIASDGMVVLVCVEVRDNLLVVESLDWMQASFLRYAVYVLSTGGFVISNLSGFTHCDSQNWQFQTGCNAPANNGVWGNSRSQ